MISNRDRFVAVRALARLVMICGAKRYGMKCHLGPVVDEEKKADRRSCPGRNGDDVFSTTYPGEGKSDPYRLLAALAKLDADRYR